MWSYFWPKVHAPEQKIWLIIPIYVQWLLKLITLNLNFNMSGHILDQLSVNIIVMRSTFEEIRYEKNVFFSSMPFTIMRNGHGPAIRR